MISTYIIFKNLEEIMVDIINKICIFIKLNQINFLNTNISYL